jgi:hypothetical protein
MAAFDGTTKTKTRVKLDKDAFSPAMGGLTGSGFTEDALIKGTRNEKVTSDITLLFLTNVTRTVGANVTDTITGNATRTTIGTTTKTCVGSVTSTMMSMYTRTVVGAELNMNIGPLTKTDIGPVTWLCPTVTMLNSGDQYETKIFKGQNYALRNTNIAVDLATRGENFQIGLHTTNIIQFQTRMEITEMAVKLVNLMAGVNVSKMVAADLSALATQGTLTAAKMLVGPRVQVPPESLPGIE